MTAFVDEATGCDLVSGTFEEEYGAGLGREGGGPGAGLGA